MPLRQQDIDALYEALHYLKMNELRALCTRYALPNQGPKVMLLERIHTFVCHGKILAVPIIPEVSRAKRGVTYALTPETYMLYGSYKNDAQTRAFFKALIGNYFHFTAYGIDWLNERWHAGNPPTYREFAAFWKTEYAARQKQKAEPKKEWAYINFVQRFLQKFPNVSRDQCMKAWERERERNKQYVMELLQISRL